MKFKRPCYKDFPVVGSQEDVLKAATHRCRFRNNLPMRINPDVCELRKKQLRNPMAASGGISPFWQCESCPGPVEYDAPPVVDLPKDATKMRCRICHELKLPERFPPDPRYRRMRDLRCYDCINKQRKENRAPDRYVGAENKAQIQERVKLQRAGIGAEERLMGTKTAKPQRSRRRIIRLESPDSPGRRKT